MMKSCFPWPALVLQKPPSAARPGWGLAYHWRMLLGWPLVDSRSRYSKPGELLAYSLKGPAISMHSYFRLQTSCWNDWQMSSDAALAMDALYNPFFLFGHQLGTLPVVVCIEAVEGSETIIPHGSIDQAFAMPSCPFYSDCSSAPEAVDLFILFDIDQNGQIDHTEFLRQVFPEEYVQDKQYMFAMGWCRMSWGNFSFPIWFEWNSDLYRFCGDHHDDHHVCLITNKVIVMTTVILWLEKVWTLYRIRSSLDKISYIMMILVVMMLMTMMMMMMMMMMELHSSYDFFWIYALETTSLWFTSYLEGR